MSTLLRRVVRGAARVAGDAAARGATAAASRGRELSERLAQSWSWRDLPRAELLAELDLGDHGGEELFLADLDGDGHLEMLWLHSPGIFKSRLYRERFGDRYRLLDDQDPDLFHLTATDREGRVLWRHGDPPATLAARETGTAAPYFAHATDRLLTVGDLDGDGRLWILALDRDGLRVIDPRDGSLRTRVELPADNYGVVGLAKGPEGRRVVVVSVMDAGEEAWGYGNPTLFLDPRALDQGGLGDARPVAHPGSGHALPILDLDGDGRDEILLGYQLVDLDGEVVWTADGLGDDDVDPDEQHVDDVAVFADETGVHFAVAGSDRLYWIDADGRVVWSLREHHPQACVVARLGPRREPRIFLANCREVMNLYDLDGHELWRGVLPEHWPAGRPKGLGDRFFHKVDPVVAWRAPGAEPTHPDLLLYSEGGWPYAVDGAGRPGVVFPTGTLDPTARKPTAELPAVRTRMDCFGYGFDIVSVDLDGDGEEEVVIYDRRSAWIYRMPSAVGGSGTSVGADVEAATGLEKLKGLPVVEPVRRRLYRVKRALQKRLDPAPQRPTPPDWRATDDGFDVRDYRSYEHYVAQQRSKLDHALDAGWIREYDVSYRRILAERLADADFVAPGASVLCLAARLGTEVKAFLDRGCFAVGIDLEPGDGNRFVVHGDFHELQFADDSVDVVFTNSLDHVLELERVLAEVRRVLAPGGHLILEAVHGRGQGVEPGRYESFFWKSVDDLIERVAAAGFVLESRRGFEEPWAGEHLRWRLRPPSGEAKDDGRG